MIETVIKCTLQILAGILKLINYLKPSIDNDRKIKTNTDDETSCCPYCEKWSDSHTLENCVVFVNDKNAKERFQMIKTSNRCRNCLTHGHIAYECQESRRCKHCNQKHHSLSHKVKRVDGRTIQHFTNFKLQSSEFGTNSNF